MNEYEISIIIPVYNAEKFLGKCLESLAERNFNDEVILVNDGSDDESEKICNTFEKKNKNVKVINQRNAGVSSARNAGIDIATRQWIMFVDADDYLISGWRKNVQEVLEKNRKNDMIIFENDIKYGQICKEDAMRAVLGYDNNIGLSLGFPFSKLYRTDILRREGIRFSTKLINGEDMIFNLKMLAVCMGAFCVPKSIYAYFKNINSATNRFDFRIIETEHEFQRELNMIFVEQRLTETRWLEIMDLSRLNGIYAVAYRVALSGENANIELLKKLISEREYEQVLLNLSSYKEKIPKIRYVALKLMAMGKLYVAIRYLKYIYFIKKNYYKNKKGIICEI